MSHDEYDRYLDDFGDRLERAAASPRVPRRRWVLGLGGSLVAAGATAAIILLTGGTAVRVRPLDAVAQARAALAPPGRIVHMVVVTGVHINRSRAVDDDAPTETWTAVSPPRWRVRQTSPPGGATDEVSYAHGSQRTYVAARDELRVQRGYSDDGAAARAPSFLGLRGAADPAGVLRGMLDSGRLRDAGERTVAGRRVRRLVGSIGATAGGQPARSLVYDVDPDTFAPVDGTLTDHVRLPRPGKGGESTQDITVVIKVKRYETLPDTPANAHLLRIATTPRTKVIVRSAAALRRDRERAAEQRKRCHPSKGGNGIVCPFAPRRSSAP